MYDLSQLVIVTFICLLYLASVRQPDYSVSVGDAVTVDLYCLSPVFYLCSLLLSDWPVSDTGRVSVCLSVCDDVYPASLSTL